MFTEAEDLLQCVECCFQFGLYQRCIELCQNPLIVNLHQAHLFKAKSLYRLYRWEHNYLCRHYSLLNQQIAEEKMNLCYSKTGECIKLLSILLDNKAIDAEGSRMLDQAMLDYIHKTNKLDKLRRCLLCRTRKDLSRSHLWPKSFLKRYSSLIADSTAARVFVSCASHSGMPKEKSPGEVTYWMLCGKCEQRLSQNGEDKFFKDIFDVVNSSQQSLNVSYGSWLYDFSIGLLFRSFVFFDITSDEIYSVFLHCRDHLLSLPVKYINTKDHSKKLSADHDAKSVSTKASGESDSDVHQATAKINTSSKKALPIFILVNPTTVDFEHPRRSMLFRALSDAGSAKMSLHILHSGKRDFSGCFHFIVTRLGNFNFLLKLNASADYVPPFETTVNSLGGGTLFVPDEKGRWNYIPEGLWCAIDEIAEVIEEATLRHYTYKVTSGTWKSPDSPEMQQYPLSSFRLKAPEDEKELHGLLEESSNAAYAGFVSRFLQAGQPSISFLPKEFKVIQQHSYTHKGHLELPQNHSILCHLTLNFTKATLTTLLVTYFNNCFITPAFYVIIVERIQGVQVAYGVHVKHSSEGMTVGEPLIDMSSVSDYHKDRFCHYCSVVKIVFRYFFTLKRVGRFETLIQRVKCTRCVHIVAS